jgi:hypothetical protein
MKYVGILLVIIGIDVLVLLLMTFNLSISSHEASLLYGEFSFIQLLENFSLAIFTNKDLALRIPMIILHILSVLLLYRVSKNYLKDYRNRIWLVLVYILLPGVISSALLVDGAGLVIFGLFLFIYIYENYSKKYLYILLFIFSILNNAFVYLFLSLIFYSVYIKNKSFLFYNSFLLIISISIYSIELGDGTPKGHLLDTLGLYSAIFTPIIFIYIFYILYKKFLSKQIDIVWFISAIPLVISLLLSFRQRVYLEDYAPYLIVALPLVAQSFYSAYRVRLKIFRTRYKAIFILSLLFLVVNFIVVFFNKELYLLIENPDKHFARKMHIAKELSQKLKKRDIFCVDTKYDMQKRLRYYGIGFCKENLLKEQSLKIKNRKDSVTISYRYRPIYSATVTNINNE